MVLKVGYCKTYGNIYITLAQLKIVINTEKIIKHIYDHSNLKQLILTFVNFSKNWKYFSDSFIK